MTNVPPFPPTEPSSGSPSAASPVPPAGPAPVVRPAPAPWPPAPAPRRRWGPVRILLAVIQGGGLEESFLEKTIEKGPSSAQIAVIRVEGIIDEAMEPGVRGALERAAHDASVKAVIIRIDSPGGGLTASDMIHNDIRTILKGKPVIAAMDGVAASGGYYIACAAPEIVAQQTTITGSIGVIGQFFFLSGLLKDKLGVVPVTLKMGAQKDWPNMFAPDMTPEQADYLMTTLLQPGYDRFVDVVAESRKMPRDEVLKLATGRVFMAKEAKEVKLIDEIGYFDKAIEMAKKKAGLSKARVVEYVQPFRLLDLLGVQSKAKSSLLMDLRPERLAALASPRIMYLWTGN